MKKKRVELRQKRVKLIQKRIKNKENYKNLKFLILRIN